MAIEGYVDVVNDREISGWVYDDAKMNAPLSVEILAGDQVLVTLVADAFRPDLAAAGKGNGKHAFRFARPNGGPPLAARLAGKRWRIQPSSAHGSMAIQHDPRRRLQHTLEFGWPVAEEAFSLAAPDEREAAIVERLIDAFHRALADDPQARERKTDLWSEIHGTYHHEVASLLRNRDVRGLAGYLREAHAKGLTFGITQGEETTATLRASPDARRMVVAEYVDNLVSLAEFLGLLDVESPAQRGQWGENLHRDLDELSYRVSAAIGFPVETPPVIGSYFGFRARGGIVTGRDLCALYATLRLRDITLDLGLSSPRLVEIGGGMGGIAYYAARSGMNFTVVDLPLVSVLQGYFLIRALPDVPIRLYGEPPTSPARIHLLPTYCFAHSVEPWDVLVNQDSFPEMNAEYALGYLRAASSKVRHAFYSINQEARAPQSLSANQGVVREIVAQAGGFRRTLRMRHWLRAGYVEELYRRTGT